MKQPLISAVFVTYHSQDCIDAALNGVRELCERGVLECIVVDNSSTPATLQRVAAHPWARVIRSGSNIGYGRAANLGWKASRTPFVLLLNPDVLIDTSAIMTLVQFMQQHPTAAIAGPALLDAGGRPHPAGARTTPWRILKIAAGLTQQPNWVRAIEPGGEPFKTDWLCGAALMMRRSAVEAVGGFDPRFFLYFEETDICLRLIAADWSIWAVGAAVARHSGGASCSEQGDQSLYTDCIARHYFQSRYYYLVKHHGRLAATAAELGEYLLLGARAAAAWLRRRSAASHLHRLRSPLLQLPPLEAQP